MSDQNETMNFYLNYFGAQIEREIYLITLTVTDISYVYGDSYQKKIQTRNINPLF